MPTSLPDQWRPSAEALFQELAAWRQAHPRATLAEMEAALDTVVHRLRAQMLQDLALASPVADLATMPGAERPTCPTCGEPLRARGVKTRHLQTTGGQDVALSRSYATCPRCGAGLFPPG